MSWWIAQNLVVTALLAAAIEIAVRVMRLRPAVSHVLWLIVLAKLVTPPFVVLNWPWANALPRELETRVLKSPASVVATEVLLSIPPGMPDVGAPQREDPVSITLTYPAARSQQQSSSSASRAILVSLLLALWVLGALMFATVQGVRIRRVRRALRSGLPADAALMSTLERLAERLSISAPRLIVATVDSPFVWAINPRHPVVLWPADIGERMPESHVRALLLHELAHLKRGDHWTGWLELTAGAIWWWNPLFWYARTKLRESAELACDQWVIAEFPEGRRDYAEALLDLCGGSSEQPLNAVGISVDGRRLLKRRLVMIMRGTAPVRMSRVALTSCALIAICIAPAWGRSGGHEAPLSTPAVETEYSEAAAQLLVTQLETIGRQKPERQASSPATSTPPTLLSASEVRDELLAIRETILEARKPGQAVPSETIQALADRGNQLIASYYEQQAAAQTPTSQPQPATPPEDDAIRQQNGAALERLRTVSESLRIAGERLRAERETVPGRSLQNVVVLQGFPKSITADEAVRMALERQLVGRDIRLAYLDLVYAQQLVNSVMESLRQIQAMVAGNQAGVSAGKVAPIDVVQARAEEARVRQQLVQAQNAMRVSELALKRLTVGDAADPLWNTRLTPADAASFRPAPDDVAAAAHADVPDQSFEDALKAAAITLQNAQNTRAFVEASLAEQQELFEAGKATNYQLVQAQRILNDASESELQAILAYRKAEVQLNRAQTAGR